jgi:Protein of unknown function (DUF4019)
MENMARNAFAICVMTFALFACPSIAVLAQPSSAIDAAARQWLFYIDGGDYAKGWSRAGRPFQIQFKAQDLQSKIAPVREPLGAVAERKFLDVKLANTMQGLPAGKYAVVQFNSRFANKAAALETVALDMENGRWTVIGYFIK